MEFNVKGSPFVEQDEPGAWDFAKNVQAPNCVSGSQKSNIIYFRQFFKNCRFDNRGHRIRGNFKTKLDF